MSPQGESEIEKKDLAGKQDGPLSFAAGQP